MLLKYFYDERLAQASYMVGCPTTGEALVIDPARDITRYLEVAQAESLTITAVTETHIHADFVSGARELAAATGARLYLSGAGGEDWQYAFPDDPTTLLYEGDTITLGTVRLDVLHTPGHTPEHLCFVLTDTGRGDAPMGIFTGDCVFVGDVGRPDLLEAAAGQNNTAISGARQQFANIDRFRQLPDYLQLFPGHGAGSVCGKALGAVPTSTLGYEKLFNPAFQFADEDEFVNWLLTDQPEVPRYFAQMKHVNRVGPTLLRDLPQAQHIKDTPTGIVPEDALFIDTRPNASFARKHLSGTINIPISAREFCTLIGWFVDYSKPVFFISYTNETQAVLHALLAVGVEDVPAYFTSEVLDNVPTEALESITPQQAYAEQLPILDVRNAAEYQTVHIPGAAHLHLGAVLAHANDLPDERFAIHCATGLRSQLIASLLRRAGITHGINMVGGMDAWQAAGLPTESG